MKAFLCLTILFMYFVFINCDKALKCSNGLCTCLRKDGTTIQKPSADIKACKCLVQRDFQLKKSRNGMVGNFIPACDKDGTYSKKQCNFSTGYCWCSDKTGQQKGPKARGRVNC